MNKMVKRNNGLSGISMWSILGGAALLAVSFVIAKNIPVIRRYLKIEMM